MGNPNYNQSSFFSIPLSGTLSEIITIQPAVLIGLRFATITSAQVYVHGATTATSADFRRMFKTDGTTHYVINAGVGSCAAVGYDSLFPFAFARLETSVAQSAVTSIEVILKR